MIEHLGGEPPPGPDRPAGQDARKTRQLGSIRILEKLGHGGMGAVYVGFDLEQRCFVAAKTLFAELAEDPRARARFEQEAKVYSRLAHPNIVSLMARSSPEDRTQYIALEYVKGTSLRMLLREFGPLPPGDVLEITEDLAKALDHAHSRGIIHRDVKPQNIVINQDGVLKLLDFGIARITSSTGVGTATGQVLGTYAYAPPEQNQGKEIDQTADLYSLGVLAWEMLVGHRFVTGNTPPEIVLQQMKGPPEPPSAHVPGLPAELDEIVRKLCQPYPENRYRSADEVCLALRNLRRDLGAARQAEAFFGDDLHEKWVLAKNALNNGQLSLAASIGKYVVSRRCEFAPAHFLLAKVYAERGLRFNAVDTFRRALALQPDNIDYLLDFALALYRFEEFDQAHREVMRLLAYDPENRIALGFEEILREQIGARRESELEVAGQGLEVPLWFDTRTDMAVPDDLDPPPATPLPTPGGELPRPGVLTRTAALGPSPSHRREETVTGPPAPPSAARIRGLSLLAPGLGHLWQGERGQALRFGLGAGVTLAGMGLAFWWTPSTVVAEFGRMSALVLGLWLYGRILLCARRDADLLARRRALEGAVLRDLGDGQYRLDLGSERGVTIGQSFEVLRASPRADAVARAPLRLGTLRVDRVRDRTAEGLFFPDEDITLAPRPGDAVRVLDLA